jgi:hypothetical protein
VSFDRVLREILRLPDETGTTTWKYHDGVRPTRHGLLSLGGVGASSARGSFWVISHDFDEAGERRTRHYHPLREDVSLEQLRLKSGDAAQIIYISDGDRDKLGDRSEFLLQTDPAVFDTDGDGVGDGDEVIAGTNPLRDESDAPARVVVESVHGVGRQLQLTVRVSDPDGQPVDALRVQWGDGSADELPQPGDGPVRIDHDYAAFGDYTLALTPMSAPGGRGVTLERRLRLEPALVRQWARQWGNNAGERATATAVAPDGGVYVGGAATTESARGRQGQGVLLKYAGTGELEWAIRAPMPAVEDLAVGPRGVVYVIGGTKLIKYDRDGRVAPGADGAPFEKELEADGAKAGGKFVTVDDAGRVYLLGNTPAPDEPPRGPDSITEFVACLDARGSERWRQKVGSINRGNWDLQWGGGRLYVMTAPTAPTPRYSLRVFDADGKEQAAIALTTDEDLAGKGRPPMPPAMTIAPGGELFVTAWAGRDASYRRLGADGSIQWDRPFGRAGDQPRGLAYDPTRGLLHIGGVTNNLQSQQLESVVVSADGEGNRVFQTGLCEGGRSYVYSGSLTATPTGHLYVAGETFGSVDAGQFENQGQGDLFVVKFSPGGARFLNAD